MSIFQEVLWREGIGGSSKGARGVGTFTFLFLWDALHILVWEYLVSYVLDYLSVFLYTTQWSNNFFQGDNFEMCVVIGGA